MNYPVVFFVFKRPSLILSSLSLIAAANPSRLYIFADGPRNSRERIQTDRVKSAIKKFSESNPALKIITSYSKSNLGLKQSIIMGLNQVFGQEKAAIILEDDCIPSPSFFHFTANMLRKYQANSRIMSVAGTSPGVYSPYSYDFSRYQLCWGWATWARAWKLYDAQMQSLHTPQWEKSLRSITSLPYMRRYWNMMLTMVKAGWIDTWDYQWAYALFLHRGLAIIPSANLVTNVGFGGNATNTKIDSGIGSMQISQLAVPYLDPPKIRDNPKLSIAIENKFYNNPVAILGMLRQYLYWQWNKYASRT